MKDSYIDDVKLESEENYRHIFNSAILGIYQLDLINDTFLSVNPELARIFGFNSVDELTKDENWNNK